MRRTVLLTLALGFALTSAQAADAPNLRVRLHAEADNGLTEKLVSLISKELRRLEGVIVTDDQPQYTVWCSVITIDSPKVGLIGYAASVATTSSEGRLIGHFAQVDTSLESLAHEVTLTVDGAVFERARRARIGKPKMP